MNNTIRFDGSNWESVKEMINVVNNSKSILSGRTMDNELITYDVTKEGKLHTIVYQDNGWLRHNYYDIEDNIIEETYEVSEEKKERIERSNKYRLAKQKSSEEVLIIMKNKLESEYKRFKEMSKENKKDEYMWSMCAATISGLMYDFEEEFGIEFDIED